jgi:hypothetical protein
MNKGLVVVGLVVLACLAITGCHPRTSAGYDMQSSKGKYIDCLKAYPNDDSKCEGLRKIYEVDKGAMEAIGGNKTNVKIEQ